MIVLRSHLHIAKKISESVRCPPSENKHCTAWSLGFYLDGEVIVATASWVTGLDRDFTRNNTMPNFKKVTAVFRSRRRENIREGTKKEKNYSSTNHPEKRQLSPTLRGLAI